MIELRPLDIGDLDAIEVIERTSYPTPWSRSMFASEIAKATSICVGAFETSDDKDDGDDETLCAYMIISRYVDAWHVMNIAVAPDHRRNGLATTLLEHLFSVTQRDARRGYTLEVRVSNTVAQTLYTRLGFKARGLRRGYYTDNREDAIIMWRDPGPLRAVRSA